MGVRKSHSESGQTALRVTLGIVILIVVGFGLHWLVPRVWHAFWGSLGGLRLSWRRRVADPVFQAFIHILILVHGRVLSALAAIALVFWVATKMFSSVSIFTFRAAAKQRPNIEENIIGQMENVQGNLRKLFADDIEKIALFGGGERAETRSENPALVGCLGCLPGFLWILISMPIFTLISIAFYDGLVRLFVVSEPDASLLASAGSHAEELRALLPIAKTVSLGPLPAVVFGDRSLSLTAILFVIGLLAWFTLGISNSGRTLPWPTKAFPFYSYCFSIFVSYVFLKSAILIFAITGLTCTLIHGLLIKFFLTPLYLRARAIMAHRNRPKAHASESDRPNAN